VTGNSRGTFPDLDYFITVPPGVREAVFEMEAADSDVDLDLMGRCDGEFSLPIDSTAAPLISSDGEHRRTSLPRRRTAGNRHAHAFDQPRLESCTYHLLVPSFSPNRPTTFTLKATLRGGSPTLTVRKGAGRAGSGAGTLQVMSRNSGLAGHVSLRGITVTETGGGNRSLISQPASISTPTERKGRRGTPCWEPRASMRRSRGVRRL